LLVKFHLVQKICSSAAERYPVSSQKPAQALAPVAADFAYMSESARRGEKMRSAGQCARHGWEKDGEDSEAEAYVSDVKFNSIDHAGAPCSDGMCPHPSCVCLTSAK